MATVLIADDDAATVKLLAAVVERAGHRVLKAVDAMQALRSAHKDLPAVIILDVMMPAGSGLNTLRQIRKSIATRQIPVIAISASTDPELPRQMVEAGALEFLPKPVDLKRLDEVLRQALGKAPRPFG